MDDDRISSLPDEILCHILSFLPTQQAVHTSVLSKRWIHLWTSVPVLDFDNRFHPFGFENFIHATIQARNLQQPITSFRLKYYQLLHRRPEDVKADINAWVNTVIDCGIENLEIRKEWERQPLCNFISLSCRILSCKTVVVLNLGRVSIAASSSVELPSLKSLRLNRAELKEPQYLMELLYGCPMLEDLHIYMLHYDHFGSVCKERFKILPKLVWADIWVVGMEIMDGNDVNVLLKTISNVKFLSISQFQVNDAVPEFPHLRDLTLLLEFHSWHSVLLMLKSCPKLQSFEFDGIFKAMNFLPYPHFVPDCLTESLTKCHLRYHQGTKNGLQLAKYILQNSTYLQVLKIGHALHNPAEVLKVLALCPRKSASCELSFIR